LNYKINKEGKISMSYTTINTIIEQIAGALGTPLTGNIEISEILMDFEDHCKRKYTKPIKPKTMYVLYMEKQKTMYTNQGQEPKDAIAAAREDWTAVKDTEEFKDTDEYIELDAIISADKSRYAEEIKYYVDTSPTSKRLVDPTKPNSRMTIYQLFVKKRTIELKEQGHEKTSKLVSAEWAECKDSPDWLESQEYNEFKRRTESDKTRYDEEMKSWTAPRKDPNAPTKPTTAYQMYCKEERPQTKIENPEEKVAGINSILSEGWKEVKAEAGECFAYYNDLAVIEKARYADQMSSYIRPPENELPETKAVKPRAQKGTKAIPAKSSWTYYSTEKRPELVKMGVPSVDVTRELALSWNELKHDPERKGELQKYLVLEADDRIRHTKETAEIKERTPSPISRTTPTRTSPLTRTPSPLTRTPPTRTPSSPLTRTPPTRTPSPPTRTPRTTSPLARTPSPAVRTPAVRTPAVRTPAVRTPAVRTPAVRTPAVRTPASEPGYDNFVSSSIQWYKVEQQIPEDEVDEQMQADWNELEQNIKDDWAQQGI
jgi:hypothetical protein